LWIEEQEKAQQSLLETEVPFLIVEAEKDDVVRNDVMKRYYETCEKAGKPHEYCVVSGEESDHSVVVMCPVLAGVVLKNVVNFFDRQIELRMIKKVQQQF
jgi:alpha-beta hydrolase superfamily lysophospholipase